ncbi:MAG TPA: hypothetical protein VH208_14255 [Myxococcaceae bacterium]|nr:hypothetical protein [Myxococcaceae bacterium]
MKLPVALKIFFFSLVCGVGGGYVGFRVAYWLALRFLRGDYAELLAILIAALGALLVGASAAITGGVMAGRRRDEHPTA